MLDQIDLGFKQQDSFVALLSKINPRTRSSLVEGHKLRSYKCQVFYGLLKCRGG